MTFKRGQEADLDSSDDDFPNIASFSSNRSPDRFPLSPFSPSHRLIPIPTSRPTPNRSHRTRPSNPIPNPHTHPFQPLCTHVSQSPTCEPFRRHVTEEGQFLTETIGFDDVAEIWELIGGARVMVVAS